MTAGTAMLMWIGEMITENGIGNGISLIIMAGIVSRLPRSGFGQELCRRGCRLFQFAAGDRYSSGRYCGRGGDE